MWELSGCCTSLCPYGAVAPSMLVFDTFVVHGAQRCVYRGSRRGSVRTCSPSPQGSRGIVGWRQPRSTARHSATREHRSEVCSAIWLGNRLNRAPDRNQTRKLHLAHRDTSIRRLVHWGKLAPHRSKSWSTSQRDSMFSLVLIGAPRGTYDALRAVENHQEALIASPRAGQDLARDSLAAHHMGGRRRSTQGHAIQL